jgi:hypothetical protein
MLVVIIPLDEFSKPHITTEIETPTKTLDPHKLTLDPHIDWYPMSDARSMQRLIPAIWWSIILTIDIQQLLSIDLMIYPHKPTLDRQFLLIDRHCSAECKFMH